VDGLAAAFLSCTLPREAWTHSAHLIVGLWHIDRYGTEEALSRLRVAIRRLNESHGTPNSDDDGYHETITRAYVQLLSQYYASCAAEMSLGERVTRLLRSPLADRDVLYAFYSRETLTSADARSRWVEPDIAPLLAGSR
jgi:hypothetical protein